MEKELRERLRENEMICWQGVQADFPLLDGANRRNILMRWMGTVGLTVVVLVLHISNEEVPNSGFVGLVVLAAVMIMGAPLVEWRSLRQQRYKVLPKSRTNSFDPWRQHAVGVFACGDVTVVFIR